MSSQFGHYSGFHQHCKFPSCILTHHTLVELIVDELHAVELIEGTTFEELDVPYDSSVLLMWTDLIPNNLNDLGLYASSDDACLPDLRP